MTIDGREPPESSGNISLRRALLAYVHTRAQAFDAARRQLRIGDGDARALLHIAEQPGIRPSELRGLLGITSAGVTALIDRLVERDVVRRETDPTDRRVSRIHLTIDLDAEPWVLLSRFDKRFEDAVSLLKAADVELFARSLGDLTRAAVSAGRVQT